MGVIKPIPKKLLIHTVTHAKEQKKDRWGKTELADEQELKRVRLEPTSKIVRDKNGAEVQLAATLFYDCKNSRPQGMVFAIDGTILFNGEKYSVQLVEPLYDGERLHHYELGLIRHA